MLQIKNVNRPIINTFLHVDMKIYSKCFFQIYKHEQSRGKLQLTSNKHQQFKQTSIKSKHTQLIIPTI